jgi:hypothetical protein
MNYGALKSNTECVRGWSRTELQPGAVERCLIIRARERKDSLETPAGWTAYAFHYRDGR